MKALVLNGEVTGEDIPAGLIEVLLDELQSFGWEVESLLLRDLEIAPCKGCFGCWVRTPGVCTIADAGRTVASAVINSDLAIFLTPVTFGGYSSETKKAVDRLLPLSSPFFRKVEKHGVHHQLYARPDQQ